MYILNINGYFLYKVMDKYEKTCVVFSIERTEDNEGRPSGKEVIPHFLLSNFKQLTKTKQYRNSRTGEWRTEYWGSKTELQNWEDNYGEIGRNFLDEKIWWCESYDDVEMPAKVSMVICIDEDYNLDDLEEDYNLVKYRSEITEMLIGWREQKRKQKIDEII